jgi:hypothetical protein
MSSSSSSSSSSARKAEKKDGEKKEKDDLAYALQTGMATAVAEAKKSVFAGGDKTFAGTMKHTLAKSRTCMSEILEFVALVGGEVGNPEEVARLRRACAGGHGALRTMLCLQKQAAAVEAHVANLPKPLELPAGKTFSDIVAKAPRIPESHKDVEKGLEALPFFKDLLKAMGEKRGGKGGEEEEEEEVQVKDTRALKERITCPITLEVMSEPMRRCDPFERLAPGFHLTLAPKPGGWWGARALTLAFLNVQLTQHMPPPSLSRTHLTSPAAPAGTALTRRPFMTCWTRERGASAHALKRAATPLAISPSWLWRRTWRI